MSRAECWALTALLIPVGMVTGIAAAAAVWELLMVRLYPALMAAL